MTRAHERLKHCRQSAVRFVEQSLAVGKHLLILHTITGLLHEITPPIEPNSLRLHVLLGRDAMHAIVCFTSGSCNCAMHGFAERKNGPCAHSLLLRRSLPMLTKLVIPTQVSPCFYKVHTYCWILNLTKKIIYANKNECEVRVK
jgi:hypothetical protein